MSWQLGATTVLVLALAGGFAWYERARPDARMVALIATLAAFAALGRIAFAAVPNVKPTTDIVLITGYTLGGAPGFAVGAIAGLTSNFFFGQGPWTTWQMAAWGATGVIGASLAILTRRRIGRVPLALVCCAVGFAFTAFQDLGDWVNFSDHSASQLGVYVGKGLGFDAVHAAACLAFALAFGPALRRSIERFATRLHVSWRPAGSPVIPALAALCAGGALAVAAASPAPARAAADPTSYLLAAQNPDGGLGGVRGQASSPLFSGWAALGLASVGRNPSAIKRDGTSLLRYVASSPPGDPGSLERTILVIGAAGGSARSFAGTDLVAELQREVRPNGSLSDQVNLTSFAVLALRSAAVTPPARMIDWLLRQQDRDGGFNFAGAGATSDVDDTGGVLEALAGAGPKAARTLRRAVAFIRAQQDRDGGFPASGGAGSNAQSTGWAIQGLVATGVDPGGLHRGGARSPLTYLRSLIAPDGHVRYSRSTDQTPVWVTAQALMALAGKPLPLVPLPAPAPKIAPRSSSASRPGQSPKRRAAPQQAGALRAAAGPAARARVAARRRSARTADMPSVLAAASDLGLATAIVLAPVGLG
jgi:energy-coupling factor transport system substrate-specific component